MRPATIGLVALCIAGALGLALSGCGASALERHTMAAGILHGGAGVAASVIDQGAREAAGRAGDADEIAEALRPWRRAEAVQHTLAVAVEAYVAEVLAMAMEDAGEPDTTRALRALRHAVAVYGALVELLAEYGVTLPSVARVLALVGEAMGPVERAMIDAYEWTREGVGGVL